MCIYVLYFVQSTLRVYLFDINIIHINDMMWFDKHLDVIFKYIIPLKVNYPSNTIVISLRLGMGENEVAQPSPFESALRLPFDYYRQSINYFINKIFAAMPIQGACSNNKMFF